MLDRRLIYTALLSAFALSRAFSCSPNEEIKCFSIPPQLLADALDLFSEQSGLQVIYDHSSIVDASAAEVTGQLAVDTALSRLLAKSGLEWVRVNERTVAIRRPTGVDAGNARSPNRRRPASVSGETLPISELSVVEVWADPRRILPNAASESSFGFAKPLLETPRSVSFISEQAIELFGFSAVEDLVRMVPGVFTTTRYGIQGAVDVRAVPADMFFRGMRRLSLQGHGRSVLAAMDTIEIVGGPPAPIYGMGKIGGYSNVVPKSGRAQSGSYLTEVEGFVQVIGGSYRRRELSFGAGGPLSVERFDRRGGYYFYGLNEDSGSYTRYVPVKQQLLQAAISIDDFAGPFRLEAGTNYQLSRTAGALTGRFTQDLVDNGRYIRGTPLVDLDANGNGRVGYLEMHRESPALGALNAGNQPLMQYWDWPTDANGRPLPIDRFPVVAGIPQAMYDYLVANPQADPTGALRAQGVGGPLPQSGFVPIGMVLDPRTVGYDTGTIYRSEFSELGIALMSDIDVGSRWNFLLGARVDRSHARNVKYASSFNPVAGTSANPGAYSGVDVGTSAWDDAVSWSASSSYALTSHIRPYVTVSRSAIVLDGNNNALSNEVIDAGHIGSASLAEVGIKASFLEDRLFAAVSAYEQARTNVDLDDPAALIYAYPTATKARGWSAEIKWVPTRNLFVSAYAMHQVTRYDPNYASSQLVDARTLGFRDVLDANGNVIYPAEAFLYGGRSRVVLPANMPQYAKKQGNPETQLGFAATYEWNHGLGFSLSGNYFSDTCTGRLCTVWLPEGVLASAGAFFNAGRWMVKLDINNLFDATYFRARTGDTLGNPLAQVLPDRRWQLTLKAGF